QHPNTAQRHLDHGSQRAQSQQGSLRTLLVVPELTKLWLYSLPRSDERWRRHRPITAAPPECAVSSVLAWANSRVRIQRRVIAEIGDFGCCRTYSWMIWSICALSVSVSSFRAALGALGDERCRHGANNERATFDHSSLLTLGCPGGRRRVPESMLFVSGYPLLSAFT